MRKKCRRYARRHSRIARRRWRFLAALKALQGHMVYPEIVKQNYA